MVKKKNLASSVLSVGINGSVGSISVENGTGSYFSGLESGSYLTITPFGELPTPDNSEIVKISSVSGDVLNVQRGMLNTTAKSFSQGAIVTNAIYVEDFVDTTYSEISVAEINDGTSSTPRAISGRRASDLLSLADYNAYAMLQERSWLGHSHGDGYETKIVSDDIDFATLAFGNYSTSEVDTGFKWVDGKTIYRKTLTGSITGAAGSRPNVTLVDSGVDTLVSAEGTWRYGDAGEAPWVPIGGVVTMGSGAINTNIGLDVRKEDSGAIKSYSTTNYARTTGTNYQITLKYTKI